MSDEPDEGWKEGWRNGAAESKRTADSINAAGIKGIIIHPVDAAALQRRNIIPSRRGMPLVFDIEIKSDEALARLQVALHRSGIRTEPQQPGSSDEKIYGDLRIQDFKDGKAPQYQLKYNPLSVRDEADFAKRIKVAAKEVNRLSEAEVKAALTDLADPHSEPKDIIAVLNKVLGPGGIVFAEAKGSIISKVAVDDKLGALIRIKSGGDGYFKPNEMLPIDIGFTKVIVDGVEETRLVIKPEEIKNVRRSTLRKVLDHDYFIEKELKRTDNPKDKQSALPKTATDALVVLDFSWNTSQADAKTPASLSVTRPVDVNPVKSI